MSDGSRGVLACLIVSMLAACGEDPGKSGGGEAGAKPRSGPPTFADDVAPIVHAKCSACHHEDGPGPFALLEYEQVRDHGAQIVEVTHSGYMPPWLPAPSEQGFELEQQRRLSEADKRVLAQWVEAGMPAGDLSRAPTPPRYESGWQLGEPDLELQAEAAFELGGDGVDIYRNFVIPVPPIKGPPRFVKAVELRPGPAQVVHHAVMRIDHSGEARRLDAADPEPGFDGMVFGGAKMPGGRFIGWTPGKSPDPGSDERSWQLTGGAELVVQVHLRPSGKPESIRPVVGLHFAEHPPSKTALAMVLSSTDIDIPPGERDYRVSDSFELPADVEVLSVYPHAHYVGKRLAGYATLPDGSRRELIRIEDWDFNWQDQYRYQRPLMLPKGSVITMDFRYDNSADNPRNPSSPPAPVSYGPNSSDEMAELILEIEPVNPAELALLDEAFMGKWLSVQIETLERALARQGEDPREDSPQDAQVLADLAALLARAGRLRAAQERYEASLALRDDASTRVDFAILLAAREQAQAAEAQLDAALRLEPQHARAQLVRGNHQRLAGDYAAAIASYERAIAADGELVEAHNNLGVTYEKLEQPARAAEAFARAVELSPSRALFHENHGRALEAAKQYAEALAAYRAALERSAGSIKAMRGAAWILAVHPDAKLRDPEQALRIADAAARMTGYRSPEVMEALAAALAASGRFGPASEAIARAIELALAAQRPDLAERYRAHAAAFSAHQPVTLDAG